MYQRPGRGIQLTENGERDRKKVDAHGKCNAELDGSDRCIIFPARQQHPLSRECHDPADTFHFAVGQCAGFVKGDGIDLSHLLQCFAGTNQLAALSAIRAMGAFLSSASCTIRMSFCKELSSPTFVARMSIAPKRLIVPQNTVSPTTLSTGTYILITRAKRGLLA